MKAFNAIGVGLATILFAGCATDAASKQQLDALTDRVGKDEARLGDLEKKVDAQAGQIQSLKVDAQKADDAARRAEDAASRAQASADKAAKAFELKQRK
jgi:outer membrane murein-binding lipoprotein Lpp